MAAYCGRPQNFVAGHKILWPTNLDVDRPSIDRQMSGHRDCLQQPKRPPPRCLLHQHHSSITLKSSLKNSYLDSIGPNEDRRPPMPIPGAPPPPPIGQFEDPPYIDLDGRVTAEPKTPGVPWCFILLKIKHHGTSW